MAKKKVAVSLRKPPSVEADAFVANAIAINEPAIEFPADQATGEYAEPSQAGGLTAVVAPAASHSVRTEFSPSESQASAIPCDSEGRQLRGVMVYLPHDVARELAAHCLRRDRDMSNFVSEAVGEHLHRQLAGKPANAAPDPLEALRAWVRSKIDIVADWRAMLRAT